MPVVINFFEIATAFESNKKMHDFNKLIITISIYSRKQD